MNKKENYLQDETIRIIKRRLNELFCLEDFRIIKIHGSKFQESGLLDLIILIREPLNSRRKVWIEIKRNWKDDPTPLQKWNIMSLDFFGIETGVAVGEEFKQYLNGKYLGTTDIKNFLKKKRTEYEFDF